SNGHEGHAGETAHQHLRHHVAGDDRPLLLVANCGLHRLAGQSHVHGEALIAVEADAHAHVKGELALEYLAAKPGSAAHSYGDYDADAQYLQEVYHKNGRSDSTHQRKQICQHEGEAEAVG